MSLISFVSRAARKYRPSTFLTFMVTGLLASGSVAAQVTNVVLTPAGATENEPSVAINRKNPRNIIVATSSHVYRSVDGGATWETCTLSAGVANQGDNVVVSDKKGDLYLFHLSGGGGKSDRIACQVSKDNGATWSLAGVMDAAGADVRRPSVTVDVRTGEFLIQWTQYDEYGSEDETRYSRIMIAESKDGRKWSTPLPISRQGDCRDGNATPKGATSVISRDGYRICTWSHDEKIYADRSFDKGRIWLSNDIEVEKQPGGSNLSIPGLAYGGGLPTLIMNNVPGRYAGSLYLFWADQRNGQTDADIWFSRSVNFGDNWIPATRINDDAKGKQQFMPAAAIDQTNGNMYVAYYDRRNYDDNQTDVYLAYSTDQGTNFKNVRISQEPFTPDPSVPLGDCIGLDVHNGLVVSAWTRYDEGTTRVVVTILRPSDLAAALSNASASPE